MAGDNKLTMFGKSFDTVGDTKANMCLKTAGDIKVQTPNRFVTIFKNGKLNVENDKVIFHVSSEEDMKKDGIYVVTSTDSEGNKTNTAYLYIDGNKILIASDTDGFISYVSEQELTNTNIEIALKNIGVYFDTLDKAKEKNLQRGLVYILETQTLYKIIDGEYVEIGSSSGSSGSDNNSSEESEDPKESTTLQIGSIFIDGTGPIINADGSLTIQVNGQNYFSFYNSRIYPEADMVINSQCIVQSESAGKGESGFMLYTDDNGETWIEIDNIIVHNSSMEYEPTLNPTYIGSSVKNMIRKASWVSAPTTLELSLKYTNQFKEGDIIAVHCSGGNAATISFYKDTDEGSTGEGNNESWVCSVTLEKAPVINPTIIKVFYNAIMESSDGDDPSIVNKEVTVTLNTITEEDGSTTCEGIQEITDWNPEWDSVEITGIQVVSGDSDIYYSSDSSSAVMDQAVLYIGYVQNVSPLEIVLPNQPTATNSVLDNLKYAIISKVGELTNTDYILWHQNENISLLETTAKDKQTIDTRTISKIGNLSDIQDPSNNTEYLSGHGIYSDHLIGVNPTFLGGTFEGNEDISYPKYGETLEIPEDVVNDDYNNAIPSVEWVKALISSNSAGTLSRNYMLESDWYEWPSS